MQPTLIHVPPYIPGSFSIRATLFPMLPSLPASVLPPFAESDNNRVVLSCFHLMPPFFFVGDCPHCIALIRFPWGLSPLYRVNSFPWGLSPRVSTDTVNRDPGEHLQALPVHVAVNIIHDIRDARATAQSMSTSPDRQEAQTKLVSCASATSFA